MLCIPQMGPLSWLPLILFIFIIYILFLLKNTPPIYATPPTPPRALPLIWVW